MTDELKPCPFCGEAPELGSISVNVPGGDRNYFVECNNLACCIRPHTILMPKSNAIAVWNTRAGVTDGQFSLAVHDGEAWQRVRTCEWREGLGDVYDTQCGEKVVWEPFGTPPCCPYCGGLVKVVQDGR